VLLQFGTASGMPPMRWAPVQWPGEGVGSGEVGLPQLGQNKTSSKRSVTAGTAAPLLADALSAIGPIVTVGRSRFACMYLPVFMIESAGQHDVSASFGLRPAC
jgi:hypothetical protein